MLYEELAKIVADNNLIEKSKELFWKVIQIYLEDNLEEFNRKFGNYDKRAIELYIDNVIFRVHSWPSDNHCCVLVNVNIAYNNKVIGYSDIQYGLEGEIDDDLLVIY